MAGALAGKYKTNLGKSFKAAVVYFSYCPIFPPGNRGIGMKLILFFIRYSIRCLRFYWRAHTRYDVHSPFVSDLLEATLEDRRWYYIFDRVTQLREKLSLNDDPIQRIDHGAGSQAIGAPVTMVNSIARYSAVPPPCGRLLFRIVNFLRPRRLLELGTSLGISAIYQMAACRNGEMVTMEGNPALAALARENLKELGMDQVTVLTGRFRDLLPTFIEEQQEPIDFFYFDGDHRRQPTLAYFEQCLQVAHDDSVFCIGDIYWSAEMEQCWKELRRHPRVRLSIDLFHFGLLFLRTEQRQNEDFSLVAARWKPWRMGFWS